MIIHRYKDGSQGYEYQIGDRVIVLKVIGGGWFNYGPIHSQHCYVMEREPFNRNEPCKFTDIHKIKYSENWGYASCFPWMLEPHEETLAHATVHRVE